MNNRSHIPSGKQLGKYYTNTTEPLCGEMRCPNCGKKAFVGTGMNWHCPHCKKGRRL